MGMLVVPKRSEPTVLDLLSAIGERNQDLSNEALYNYMDRDFLKISQQWSQTIMEHDGECDVVPSLDDEPEISLLEIVNSLSEECALLEVSAVEVLASLEYEMDKSADKNKIQCYASTNNECWINEDGGMSEEIRNLEEAMKSLEEELKGTGDNMACSESVTKLENISEMKEIHKNNFSGRSSILEDKIDMNIYTAASA